VLQTSIITDRNVSSLTLVLLATFVIVIVIAVVSQLDIFVPVLQQNLMPLGLLVENKLKFIVKKVVVLGYLGFS